MFFQIKIILLNQRIYCSLEDLFFISCIKIDIF